MEKQRTYRQGDFVLDKEKERVSRYVKGNYVWRLMDANQEPVYTGDIFKYLRKSDQKHVYVQIARQTTRIMRSISVQHYDIKVDLSRGRKFLVMPEDLAIYWHQEPKAKAVLSDTSYIQKNEQRLQAVKLALEARQQTENRLAAQSLITATTANQRISNIAQDFLVDPTELRRYRDDLIAKYVDPSTTDEELETLSKVLPATRQTLRNIRLTKLRVERGLKGGRK